MNGARVAGFMWVRLVVGWRWRRIQRPRRGLLRLSQSFELFGRCARRCRLWTVRTNFFFLFREIKRSTSLSFCLCTHKVTCVYASPRNISKKVYIYFFWLLLSSRAGFVWRYTHNFPQKLRLRLCHVRYFFILLFPWLFISSFLFGLPVLVVGHIRSVSLSLLIRPSQLVIFTHSNSREPFSRVCALGVASK